MRTDAVPNGRALFWTLQLCGWLAYGTSTYMAVLPELGSDELLRMAGLKAVRTSIGFGLSLVAWRLYRAVRGGGTGVLATACFVGTVAGSLGAAWLFLYWSATGPLRGADFYPTDWSAFPRAALDHAFVLLVWSALYFGFHGWKKAERSARRRAEARAEARGLELRMLRLQLNPHFLFNALTSLRASIPAGARKSRHLVDQIAGFLRHALATSGRPMVPLREEVDGVRRFFGVERSRHGDDLLTDVRMEEGAGSVPVPGFLLQPLVENAVTHGLASGARPVRISLRAARLDGELQIEVVNTVGAWKRLENRRGDAEAGLQDEPGVGLENVERRLRLAYGDDASFDFSREPDRARATIRIPADPRKPEAS